MVLCWPKSPANYLLCCLCLKCAASMFSTARFGKETVGTVTDLISESYPSPRLNPFFNRTQSTHANRTINVHFHTILLQVCEQIKRDYKQTWGINSVCSYPVFLWVRQGNYREHVVSVITLAALPTQTRPNARTHHADALLHQGFLLNLMRNFQNSLHMLFLQSVNCWGRCFKQPVIAVIN